MDFSYYAMARYRNRSAINILEETKDRMNYGPEIIHPEFVYLFYQIFHNDPCSYWDEDVCRQTLDGLESLYNAHSSDIDLNYEIMEHFFIGYFTYTQITTVINDLSNISDSQLIKNRMYRLPTYISILEGCLTHLFRFIVLILDQCNADKDFAAHKKLAGLCDILKSNGFEKLVDKIDIDIRNAINHGGVIMTNEGNDLLFRYTKNRNVQTKEFKSSGFDRLIDCIFDTASAVLLGVSQFINNHHNLISVDRTENSYVAFNLLAMQLSLPEIQCTSISDIHDFKQLNINLCVKETEKSFYTTTAFEIVLQIYPLYPNYDQYFIAYQHERMLLTFIRFTNKEVFDALNRKREMSEILQDIIRRGEISIPDPSVEEIDMQEIKYFRFPTFKNEKIKINSVENVSIGNRKRLRAHMFIGNVTCRENIIELIKEGLDWVKYLRNPPLAQIETKHGDMEADSIYMNVYREDRRREKNLLPSNENFVCMVDYNINGITTIKHGGIPQNIWDKYPHENLDNMLITWRTNEYALPKVGRNDPCPCGSGKKFKVCCGKTS